MPSAAALKPWPAASLWAALLVLSAPVGVYALRYWSGDPALLPFELRLNMLHNPPAFILHTSFGGLALLLAPWQFVARLRQRKPQLHRGGISRGLRHRRRADRRRRVRGDGDRVAGGDRHRVRRGAAASPRTGAGWCGVSR